MTPLTRGVFAAATTTVLALSAFAPANCHAQSVQGGAANVTATAPVQTSPYVGQDRRTLKSLSDQEIADILAGRGVGLARPAELNHYPGPLHALQFKEQISLTPDQTLKIEAIFDRMSRDAKAFGKQWIDRERALEAGFGDRTITAERVSTETVAIGEVQGRLRAVHLEAHIATRAVLTPDQIAMYDVLRGYRAIAGHQE